MQKSTNTVFHILFLNIVQFEEIKKKMPLYKNSNTISQLFKIDQIISSRFQIEYVKITNAVLFLLYNLKRKQRFLNIENNISQLFKLYQKLFDIENSTLGIPLK